MQLISMEGRRFSLLSVTEEYYKDFFWAIYRSYEEFLGDYRSTDMPCIYEHCILEEIHGELHEAFQVFEEFYFTYLGSDIPETEDPVLWDEARDDMWEYFWNSVSQDFVEDVKTVWAEKQLFFGMYQDIEEYERNKPSKFVNSPLQEVW